MKLEVLTDKQTTRLHEASLHLLARVGVHVPHPDVLRRFEEAGALVEGERVRLPEA